MAVTGRWLSLEEFLALPEEQPALEYVDGEVVQKVSPKYRHVRLQYGLADLVNGFAVPRRLARAEPELRVSFGGRSVVPDVAIFAWERIPEDEHGEVQDDVFIAPDIAVEIRSPGQSLDELIDKCRRYLRHGTELAVVVDPDDEIVVLVRPDGSATTLRGDERIDLAPVLPGFELTVGELFATLQLE